MYAAKTDPATRKRKPSKRALETRRAVFEAAEALFAERGFEGTSIRDIASRAGVTSALVSFHGQSKQALFESVVAARAETLSTLREDCLDAALADGGDPGPREILGCFVRPLLDKSLSDDPGWRAYARPIAMVSADPQWRDLTARCFDPTVARFSKALARHYPHAAPEKLAAALVFSISAMLSLSTSIWRIEAIAGGEIGAEAALIDSLLDYASAGMAQVLAG